jgi:hypothetical protein
MFYAVEYVHGKNRPAPGREKLRMRAFRTAVERDDWVDDGGLIPGEGGFREAVDAGVALQFEQRLEHAAHPRRPDAPRRAA